MEGAAPDAGSGNPPRAAEPFPTADATTGMDTGFKGVLAAAVSAMILRKSALPVSTVFDFHIGVLAGVDEPDVEAAGWKGVAPRLRGVIDLEPLFGVRTSDALVVGVGRSSSIWKIPSAADDLSETSALGLTIGEGGGLRLGATGLAEERSTGDIADLALYLKGCRTIGAGMSCTNSHSRCFAINSFTSTPSLATGDRFFCFSAITLDRSCRTLCSISSNKPLSSMVSRHEMM